MFYNLVKVQKPERDVDNLKNLKQEAWNDMKAQRVDVMNHEELKQTKDEMVTL